MDSVLSIYAWCKARKEYSHAQIRDWAATVVDNLDFCRDTEALDTTLTNAVSSFLTCLVSVVGAMLVVLAVTPAVLFAVVPLSLAYRYIQVSSACSK